MPATARLPTPTLNERQQLYLLAAYRLDQQREQLHRFDYVRGREPAPASEWRLLPYGRWQHLPGRPATELRQLIEAQQQPGKRLVDPGAGSTWKALAERGLVDIEERVIVDDPDPRIGYGLPHIRLTRAGRKFVRELTGEVRPPRPRRSRPQPPEGLLPSGAWRALVLAYQQAAAGVARDRQELFSARYAGLPSTGFEWLHGLGLVAEGPRTGGLDGPWPESYRITPQGRDYYQRYYRVNATAYPRREAELPHPELSSAERTFWRQVHDLSRQRDFAGLDEAKRAASRQQLLRLQLSQPASALYVAPYWYPALAGRVITTAQNRSAEDFRCNTEAEALALVEQLKTRWQQQLATLSAQP